MGIPNIYKYLNTNQISIMSLLDNPAVNTIVTKHFDMKPAMYDKEEKCDQIVIVARNTFKYLYGRETPYFQKYEEIQKAISACLEHDLSGTVSRFQKDFNCIIPKDVRSLPQTYNIPLLNMDLETLDAALNHIKNNYKKYEDITFNEDITFVFQKEEDFIKEIHIKNVEPYNIMEEECFKFDKEDPMLKEEQDIDQLSFDLFGYLEDLYNRNTTKLSFMLGRYSFEFNICWDKNILFKRIGENFNNYSAEDLRKVVNYFKRESENVK